MKTRLRVIAATLVGAMMLMTLTGCSKTEDRSPAMAETATPTAIPTTGGRRSWKRDSPHPISVATRLKRFQTVVVAIWTT